jgi:cell division inhibitor SepF
MAERLKRAAAWLGLVTDDRYADYDDVADYEEMTEDASQEEASHDSPGQSTHGQNRLGQNKHSQIRYSADEPFAAADKPATVTPLESRRSTAVATSSVVPAGSTTLAPHSRTADVSRIITVHPRTYNDARVVGEHFRDGVPVIMNLSDMEDVDAKRLVDFAAGLIFGLRGSIERVTSKVFLLSPHDVTVAAEDKERIAGGFFNQS